MIRGSEVKAAAGTSVRQQKAAQYQLQTSCQLQICVYILLTVLLKETKGSVIMSTDIKVTAASTTNVEMLKRYMRNTL